MNSCYDKKFSPFQIFMLIVCALLVIITLTPMLNIIAVSLSGKNAIAKGLVKLIPREFTLEGYKMVFSNRNIVYSLFYSILLTIGSAVLSTVMTALAAYALSKEKLGGRRVFLTIITITMYIDAGLIPHYLLIKDLNLINTVWALIIPIMISPFNLIILRSFFMGINKSLFEAAYIDGCGEWGCLFKIAAPLSMPAVSSIMLFYGIGRWNGISDVMYYENRTKFYTLQYHVKLMLDSISIDYNANEMEEMLVTPENVRSAAIVFAMVPMLIFYPFVQKYFTKGVNIGGVKE
ncbi:MAG: carbohydrate ABC transporter permease [Lachnospiraceae bacterium]|nr:carbohydrate ABC transporter permease [Lachnospiraceae bacterium]